jgi:hypothetical protein
MRSSLLLALAFSAFILPTARADEDTRVGTVVDRQDGKFETAAGSPDWQGWNSVDHTNDGIFAWNIRSGEYAMAGDYSMVCGTDVALPGGGTDFGYANNWHKILVFTYEVPDPSQIVELHLTGTMRVDTELDYDFVHLQAKTSLGWQNFDDNSMWHGPSRVYSLNHTVTLHPEDYVGNQAQIRIYFVADVAGRIRTDSTIQTALAGWTISAFP